MKVDEAQSELDLMIATARTTGKTDYSMFSMINYFAKNYQFWRLPKYVKPKKKRTPLKEIKELLK